MADKPKPRLWGASSKGYRKELRRHKYKEIQDNDHSLYLWLKGMIFDKIILEREFVSKQTCKIGDNCSCNHIRS